MGIFRLVENVPESYTTTSRDFQLLCNLFDIMNSGVKYDINSMANINDPRLCRDIMLPYLQTKLGLFTNMTIPTGMQRVILCAFPYIVHSKGSKRGIREITIAFLHANNINGYVRVNVDKENYKIEIRMNASIINIDILDDILRYIKPTGYEIDYIFVTSGGQEETNIIMSTQYKHQQMDDSDANVVWDDSVWSADNVDAPDVKPGVGTTIAMTEEV